MPNHNYVNVAVLDQYRNDCLTGGTATGAGRVEDPDPLASSPAAGNSWKRLPERDRTYYITATPEGSKVPYTWSARCKWAPTGPQGTAEFDHVRPTTGESES